MKRVKLILCLLGGLGIAVWSFFRAERSADYRQTTGLVFGTVYHLTYRHSADLKSEVEAELQRFDLSLSPFNEASVISKVNRNETVRPDSFFCHCFERAMQLSRQTEGAFDITVAPLVNAWGFGHEQTQFPDSQAVDSLRRLVGYERVSLTPEGVHKEDARMQLTCSAVAKGYAVDVVAALLARKGIADYMVEIGGEVVVSGKNPEGGPWRIGVNRPIEDSLSTRQDLQTVLTLTHGAMATSGNYRNYYYREGKKYGHTIDPRTGYPVLHNLLSVTVVAEDCLTADALATAFMVMGVEASLNYCLRHPEIRAYFIVAAPSGGYEEVFTDGMQALMQPGATSAKPGDFKADRP